MRSFIDTVDDEFDSNAIKFFECVLQHQILRFGIHKCSLPVACNPCMSDNDASIRCTVAVITSATDDLAMCFLHNHERKTRSRCVIRDRGLDVFRHLLWRCDLVGRKTPQLIIQTNLTELCMMRSVQWEELDIFAAQCCWFKLVQL